MNSNRLVRLLRPLLALLALTACYTSVPVPGGAPSVGREVVLDLTDRGAIELAPLLGAQLETVSGRVVDFSGGRYQLSVTQTTSRGGTETIWKGEAATVPAEFVSRIYERRVNKRRTWVVVALTTVGAVLAGEAFGINTGLDGLIGGGGKTTKQ